MSTIKKHNRHSIRDIEISRTNDASDKRQSKPKKVAPPQKIKRRVPRRSSKTGKLTLFASILLLTSVVLLFYVFFRSSSADIKLYSKSKQVTVTDDIVHVAYKDPEPGQLAFEVASGTISSSVTLDADKTEYSEEKASGILTVYNNYSNKPQRIIRNTRFQSPDGKIYRVKKPFNIPGKSTSGPGSVDVRVYADEAGKEYNLSKDTRFTLPALTGEAHKGIYAVAKTDIKGGFKGKRATVSDEKKEQALEKLREQIKNNAFKTILAKLGEDKVSFQDALFIEFDDPSYNYKDDSKLEISLNANAKLPAFDKYDFTKELLASADATLDFDGNNKLYISNLEDLDLKLVNKDGLDIDEDELVKFTANGKAIVKYQIDIDKIKDELIGKNITVVNFLKDSEPGIVDIKAEIRPFWKDNFPEDPEQINIEVIDK